MILLVDVCECASHRLRLKKCKTFHSACLSVFYKTNLFHKKQSNNSPAIQDFGAIVTNGQEEVQFHESHSMKKINKMSCTPSEDSVQPWHLPSLSIWRSLGLLATHWANNEDFDQRLIRLRCLHEGSDCLLCRLIWVCALDTRFWRFGHAPAADFFVSFPFKNWSCFCISKCSEVFRFVS